MDLELNNNLGTLMFTAISGRNPQMNGLESLRLNDSSVQEQGVLNMECESE